MYNYSYRLTELLNAQIEAPQLAQSRDMNVYTPANKLQPFVINATFIADVLCSHCNGLSIVRPNSPAIGVLFAETKRMSVVL